MKIRHVRDWHRRYGPTHKPVEAPLPQSPEEMRQEIQQLGKELARVTTQRDILKNYGHSFVGLNVRYRMIEELS